MILTVGAVIAACSWAPFALAFGQVSGSPFDINAYWFEFMNNGRMEALGTAASGSNETMIVDVNPATGQMEQAASSPFDPNSCCSPGSINPAGTMLAALSDDMQGGGAVATYSVDPTTAATAKLYEQDAGFGEGIRLAVFDPTGTLLLVGNLEHEYSGGFTLYHVDQSTGALTSPFSLKGSTDTWAGTAGAFSPDDRYLAVVGFGTVYLYAIDQTDGSLTQVANVTPPSGTADLAFSPDGRFLAVGGQGITMYSVDRSTGSLTEVPGSPFAGGGDNIAFNPAGDRLAANANTAGTGVAVYAVDTSSGALSQVGGSPFAVDVTAYLDFGLPPYLGYSPDGSLLTVAVSNPGTIGGTMAVFSTAADPPTASITSLADGQTYALGQSVPVSFTCTEGSGGPGISGCYDSGGAPGSGGALDEVGTGALDTATPGAHQYSVTAISGDGQTNVATIRYTVISPPSASISTPIAGATYTRSAQVDASYGCSEAPGGPGISSCTGTAANGAPIPTGVTGTHTFTVIATSKDGQQSTASVSYQVVLPGNHFSFSHVRMSRGGVLSLQIKLPGPGWVSLLETASRSASAATAAIGAGRDRFVFGYAQRRASEAGVLRITLRPSARGRRTADTSHKALSVLLWIRYTPAHGVTRQSAPIRIRLPARS